MAGPGSVSFASYIDGVKVSPCRLVLQHAPEHPYLGRLRLPVELRRTVGVGRKVLISGRSVRSCSPSMADLQLHDRLPAGRLLGPDPVAAALLQLPLHRLRAPGRDRRTPRQAGACSPPRSSAARPCPRRISTHAAGSKRTQRYLQCCQSGLRFGSPSGGPRRTRFANHFGAGPSAEVQTSQDALHLHGWPFDSKGKPGQGGRHRGP